MDKSSPSDEVPRHKTEVLEIEDEEQRQERMHSLLSRLNAQKANSRSGVSAAQQRPDIGDRTTLPAGPPLELLSRVQAFLPELAASNAELVRRARENPESVDIESIGEHEEQYIEMNLGLGVFEHRGELPPGIPVADVDLDVKMRDSDSDASSESEDDLSATSSSDSSSDSSSSEDDSSSDGDSDSEVDIIVSSDETRKARPTKPLPKRKLTSESKKPEIVVLSETVTEGSPPLK
ncbi:hypothetical protein BV20DRAFT_970665 [Pilatotrama ljubarskyi]|nr:hypothetical protein BV20DRAFT_970665 [Pilatotrama ljubarskyi]